MSFSDNIHLIREMFPSKARWTLNDIPDLAGKIIIVTGGNSGIGKAMTKVLLQHNATVYIACRASPKTSAAVSELRSATGKSEKELKVLPMDLSNLPTIKAAVESFLSQESQLHLLYLCAGVMWTPKSLFTAHGHDLQFGTNVLGHFYLTALLLPLLLSSAAESKVRVVSVASNGHWGARTVARGGPVLYGSLSEGEGEGGKGREGMSTVELYGQSKAGNVLFAKALARKYGSQGIVSISLNPGTINTELSRNGSSFARWALSLLASPVEKGILTPLYAGTAPEALGMNGKYLIPWARVGSNRKDMDNEEHQEKLWTWCEDQVRRYGA